ncbi:hypothetical protein K438DRAFT_1805885 [Mycena galopus ATCC 62051]|nr:hypothetical protein K438DRAFT_1805885 [Mycena galopus ATCC 62051]
MGESSAWTVLTGTAVICNTCITGLYATFTGKINQKLATASAFNSAVTAATFFTIREYLFSPTIRAAFDLSGLRRQGIDEGDSTAPDNLSWSGLRRHNLLDSGLSGAATGGLLRGLTCEPHFFILYPSPHFWKPTSGPTYHWARSHNRWNGMRLLQAAYNELGIQRIKYVGRLPQAPEVVPLETPTKPAVTTRILGVLGVRFLSDEELLVKFRREREKHLQKIQELEQKLEAERDPERNIEKK